MGSRRQHKDDLLTVMPNDGYLDDSSFSKPSVSAATFFNLKNNNQRTLAETQKVSLLALNPEQPNTASQNQTTYFGKFMNNYNANKKKYGNSSNNGKSGYSIPMQVMGNPNSFFPFTASNIINRSPKSADDSADENSVSSSHSGSDNKKKNKIVLSSTTYAHKKSFLIPPSIEDDKKNSPKTVTTTPSSTNNNDNVNNKENDDENDDENEQPRTLVKRRRQRSFSQFPRKSLIDEVQEEITSSRLNNTMQYKFDYKVDIGNFFSISQYQLQQSFRPASIDDSKFVQLKDSLNLSSKSAKESIQNVSKGIDGLEKKLVSMKSQISAAANSVDSAQQKVWQLQKQMQVMNDKMDVEGGVTMKNSDSSSCKKYSSRHLFIQLALRLFALFYWILFIFQRVVTAPYRIWKGRTKKSIPEIEQVEKTLKRANDMLMNDSDVFSEDSE